VGVPNFIDKMLNECYKKEDQDRFLAGLASFDEEAKKAHGDIFIYLKPEEQLVFVKKYNEDSVKASKEKPGPKPFFLMAKELTLMGYFTSEEGATKVLQYEAVPGAYKGCIPLKEAGQGRTWAT
jgi:hypothetical protein